jgi:hypothetical protein
MQLVGLLLILSCHSVYANIASLYEGLEPNDHAEESLSRQEDGEAAPDPSDEVFKDQPIPHEELLSKSGDLFTESQKDITDIALEMGVLLQEKRLVLIQELGGDRLSKIQAALALPQKNVFKRAARRRALNRLAYTELTQAGVDVNAEDAATQIGAELYRASVVKGKDLDLFGVSKRVTIDRNGTPTEFTVVARPTSVDGVIFPSINLWNQDSGLAILLKPSEIKDSSRNWRRLWARKVLYADSGNGLPVIAITTDQFVDWEVSPDKVRYRFQPRAKKGALRLIWDKKFRKLWIDANGKLPNKPAFRLAGLTVTIGTAVAAGTAVLKCSVLPGGMDWGAFDWPLVFTTMAHTAVYSTFGSFFNNITSPHDPLNKLQQLTSAATRSIVNTAIFYYTYQIISAHGLSTLDYTTMAGLITHAKVWTAALTVNGIRSVFRTIELARDEMGLSRGTTRIFGKAFPKPQLEKQIYFYYPLKFLQLAELTGLPGAKELFYSAYFWMQPGIIAYLKKIGYQRAAVLETGWWNWRARLGRYAGDLSLQGLPDFASAALRAAVLAFSDLRLSCKNIAEANRITRNNPYNFGPFEKSAKGQWLEVNL